MHVSEWTNVDHRQRELVNELVQHETAVLSQALHHKTTVLIKAFITDYELRQRSKLVPLLTDHMPYCDQKTGNGM